MERCLYRAEGKEGADTISIFRGQELSVLKAMKRMEVAILSLFAWDRQMFLYYECLGEKVVPERLLGETGEQLAVWPGGRNGRQWVPMTDIFHYQQPVSEQHWKRPSGKREPYGRVALLKPEETASYIYYHYQYQEERPGDGDKYGIIGLHENMLFFYAELPATREPAPYTGKLATSLRPDHWGEVMEPHFIKWEGAPAGEDIWHRLELVLELNTFTEGMGRRNA